jgi:Spy/CpxP family protein refolding chaperone
MKNIAIVTLIALFALTGVAAAIGPGQKGPGNGPAGDSKNAASGAFWEKEKVVQALSLTEDESAKLAGMSSEHRNTIGRLRGELKEQQEALRAIMDSEHFSATDARKHFKNAEKVRSRIQEERFELNISQRQLLGQERYAKLRKMERRAMEKRRRK